MQAVIHPSIFIGDTLSSSLTCKLLHVFQGIALHKSYSKHYWDWIYKLRAYILAYDRQNVKNEMRRRTLMGPLSYLEEIDPKSQKAWGNPHLEFL
jgi:hypothetical protein